MESHDSETGELEPTIADESTRPQPQLAEQTSSDQGNIPCYDVEIPTSIAAASPIRGPEIPDNRLGSRDSRYSLYSYSNYPDISFGMMESPGSGYQLPSLSSPSHTPSLPSSLPYPESYASANGTMQRNGEFSPRPPPRQTLLAPREASLLRYYVNRISPWVILALSLKGIVLLTQVSARCLRLNVPLRYRGPSKSAW